MSLFEKWPMTETTRLVNIIYFDEERSERNCERLEGYLLTDGVYMVSEISMHIRQIKPDKIVIDGQSQQIVSVHRYFERVNLPRAV
jgi:hypothetical protein